MPKRIKAITGTVSFFVLLVAAANSAEFNPGETWLDDAGQPIEAHGGGVLLHDGRYYWYGENHARGVGNKTGISCFSSADLVHWQNEGVVLPKTELPEDYRDTGVCERPKVLFNPSTKKYVMWMHLDNENYTHALAGVAVADSPTGVFKLVRRFRPIVYDYGSPRTDERSALMQEKARGTTFRDCSLFQDEDAIAYAVYSSEDNASIYIVRLNADYTDIARPTALRQTWVRAVAGVYREAPVLFRSGSRYFLITSGVTGWGPNAAAYAIAPAPLGQWETVGNPCAGVEAEVTFRAQGTAVLPAPGNDPNKFIFLADHWTPEALERSTYVWLPFELGPRGEIVIEHYDHWGRSVFAAPSGGLAAPQLSAQSTGLNHELHWLPVPSASGYRVFKDGRACGFTTACNFIVPPLMPGIASRFAVVAVRLNGLVSPASTVVTLLTPARRRVYLDEVKEDHYVQGWGTLMAQLPGAGPAIELAGHKFSRGLSTHAASEITYTLGGRFDRFETWAGRAHGDSDGKVAFRVYGDDRLLYLGPVVTGKDQPQHIGLSVEGIMVLKLIVTDGGDGNAFDDAFWAEAQLRAASSVAREN